MFVIEPFEKWVLFNDGVGLSMSDGVDLCAPCQHHFQIIASEMDSAMELRHIRCSVDFMEQNILPI